VDRPVEVVAAPKSLSIFGAVGTYVLGILWTAAIMNLISLTNPGKRVDMGLVWLSSIPVIAVPICALAFGFWRNRAGFRVWSRAKRAGIALSLCVQWVAWLVVFVLPTLSIDGTYGDKAVRAKMSENISVLATSRDAIAKNVLRTGKLERSGAGVALPAGKWVDFALVGTDGMLLTYNATFRALTVLEPRIIGRGLHWDCSVYPDGYTPYMCSSLARSRPTTFSQTIDGTLAEHAAALLEMAKPLRASAKNIGRRLPPSGALDFGYQDADGSIVLYSDRHGVLMAFAPSGRCTVYPAKAVVAGCTAGAPRGGR
jgi:hypothetical protein